MRKKLIALSLVGALAVGALAGCTSTNPNASTEAGKNTPAPEATKGDPGKDTKEATKDTEPVETEPARDLKGQSFVIGDWWTDPEAEPQTAKEESDKEWQESLMKKYNFTMTRKAVGGWGEMTDLTVTSIQGEDPCADIIVLDTGFTAKPLSNNCFYDLASLDSIDLSDDKWIQATIKLMSRGDKVFGLAYGDTEPRNGIFFNKAVLKKCGVDPDKDLYDLQKEDKWDWAAYKAVCEKCTQDTDGDGQIDIYASASFSNDFITIAVASNDAAWISMDADGHFQNTLGDPKVTEALQWCMEMKEYEMPQPADSQWNYFEDAFRDGKVAFAVAEEYKANPNQPFHEMVDDYGFIMFPKGPKAKEMVQITRDNVLIIPSCYSKDKAEDVAFALSQWAEPNPDYNDEDGWKANYYPNFSDTRAVDETIALMREDKHMVINYAPLVYGIDAGNDWLWAMWGGDVAPGAVYESCKEAWDAAIADMNKDI